MFIESKSNNCIAINADLVRYLAIRKNSMSNEFQLLAYFDDKGTYLELARSASWEEIEHQKDRMISDINKHERRVYVEDGQIDTYPHQ
jgi:hypothetical protein